MQQLWLWLLITNLKVLVEVEVEIIIIEVMVIEEEVVVLVLVVAIILMVISTTVLSLLHTINLSLVHHDLQGLKVNLRDHSVKSMERMVMWLLIVITEWTLPFKASMLHPNLLLWWLVHLKFTWLMDGSKIQAVQIMYSCYT